MKCFRCQAENPTQTGFCGQCGAPLAAGCPSCGANNPPDNKLPSPRQAAAGGRASEARADHVPGDGHPVLAWTDGGRAARELSLTLREAGGMPPPDPASRDSAPARSAPRACPPLRRQPT
ncbi:MAG: hypothetical protein DME03_14905 [Candidatus Rokuibacteriota bacterium]|nr:MAG: hypothetical protein DME03_14905 [Candidatus Rokubacteria bacterium]